MAHLLSDLVSYMKFDDINIDNWMFKMYYKFSFVICMAGTMVGIASQFFGDPISCDFQGIQLDMAQDYCWIHGSAYIPPKYQAHMKCIVDQSDYNGPEDAPQTGYYQWVTFVFAIQAAVFYLPYKIWSALEGGLISDFGTDAKTPVIISEDAKYDDGVVMEAVVEKFVKYFKSIFHHNNWYFAHFVFCEFLNFALFSVQFYLTDMFLGYKFKWYGWEVINYYSYTQRERNDPNLMIRDPMCAVFPTQVSCTIPNVGAAGGNQDHNGLCVLSQNIINEKIYLALWFWYSFLGPVSIFFIFFRLMTILFDGVRFSLIYKTIRHKYDDDVRKCLTYVLNKGQIGDWFVLYQLCKNCNKYFFRQFIKELAVELKCRPKKSKAYSNGKNATLSRTGTLPREKLVLDDDALMSVLSGSGSQDEDDVKITT
eukprot:TRINITY_DN36869_c0_g1_i1.p1 TRINITY_DN36869_c0_g1~~TRINITY_DN36869_c0_g1_i1.p1  ORF type:complete len:424 (-),score=70.36 TRINITY_DN36869_c0_g1_i1:104-1375(-)